MGMQGLLARGSQTGNPASLVEIKRHCLEISFSAQNEQFIPISSLHWGSPSAPCTNGENHKDTGKVWPSLHRVKQGLHTGSDGKEI